MSKAPPEVGDKSLRGFVVAGDDKRFFPARAVIEGDRVVVWADEVPAPRAVRYAWSRNPFADLYNKDGLPASAFRTDDWPWISAPRMPK
jgi:sialate O-acetylesterase